jgi:hypothetical protein
MYDKDSSCQFRWPQAAFESTGCCELGLDQSRSCTTNDLPPGLPRMAVLFQYVDCPLELSELGINTRNIVQGIEVVGLNGQCTSHPILCPITLTKMRQCDLLGGLAETHQTRCLKAGDR